MKKSWPMVPLGEVLRHRKEFIEIDDTQSYKRCRVQLHAQGVVLRDSVPGIEIKTKKQQVCQAGEFLVAEIDAKHGGYGLVPHDLDGAIVSSHYFLFGIDDNKLDRKFLGFFSRTPAFAAQVAAQGSTNYAAIRPSHVLAYRLPLPPLPEQRRIVARIETIAAKIAEVALLAASVEAECAATLSSLFRKLSEGAPRRQLGELAPLTRRPAKVDPTAAYPQVSVRSFGRGSFHSGVLEGASITWEKPHLVLAGDILVSNIKAWEGAIAVAKPDDDGRYGSHRYLTFQPDKKLAAAEWLCHYLLSSEGLFYVGEASPGSADRNRTTSASAMCEIEIPIPSLDKQNVFVEATAKIAALKQLQSQSAAELEALLPSILDRAFRGEL